MVTGGTDVTAGVWVATGVGGGAGAGVAGAGIVTGLVLTAMVKVPRADAESASLTSRVNVYEPAMVGAPASRPSVLNFSPGGKVPAATA